MIYELRQYESQPSMVSKLQELFDRAVVPGFKRVGIQLVGGWFTISGVGGTLLYMLAFDSMEDRMAKWDTFVNDPGWVQQRKSLYDEWGGTPIAHQTNMFLKPASFSPLK